MGKQKPWHFTELKLLIENYPKSQSLEDLKPLFPNRTLGGITNRAHRIGLTRQRMVFRHLEKERIEYLRNAEVIIEAFGKLFN